MKKKKFNYFLQLFDVFHKVADEHQRVKKKINYKIYKVKVCKNMLKYF